MIATETKPMDAIALRHLEHQNKAREMAKMPLIQIKIRKCVVCGCAFESAGNRNCGCQNRNTSHLSGRDIIW